MPLCPFKLTLEAPRVEIVRPAVVGMMNGAAKHEDPRECVRTQCQWWIREVAPDATGIPRETGAGNCVANFIYSNMAQAAAAQSTLVHLKLKENKWTVNNRGEVVAAPEA